MKVSELRAILEKIRLIYAAGGAKAQAADFGRMMKVLEGREGQSVEEFVSEAKALIAQPTPKPKPKPKPRQQVDEALVNKYAKVLIEAGTNDDSFKAALSALKSDRSVAKPTLDLIVNRYMNVAGGTHVYRFETKREALERLREKFLQRAESESKDENIEVPR